MAPKRVWKGRSSGSAPENQPLTFHSSFGVLDPEASVDVLNPRFGLPDYSKIQEHSNKRRKGKGRQEQGQSSRRPDSSDGKSKDISETDSPIVNESKSLSIGFNNPPNPGSAEGLQKVSLVANYHEIALALPTGSNARTKSPETPPIFELYSISVLTKDRKEYTGRKLKQIIRLVIFHTSPFREHSECLATDFKQILVSSTPLKLEEKYQIPYSKPFQEDPEEPRKEFFTVTLNRRASIDVESALEHLEEDGLGLSQLEFEGQPHILQSLNILAGHRAKASLFKFTVGRNKVFDVYPKDENLAPIGDGLEVRRGFFSSVRATNGGLLLNLNTTSSAFYSPITLADLAHCKSNPGLPRGQVAAQPRSDNSLREFEGFIKGLRVQKFDSATITNAENQIVPDERVVYGLAIKGNTEFYKVSRYGARVGEIQKKSQNESFLPLRQGLHDDLSNDIVINVGNDKFPYYVPASLCRILPGNLFKSTRLEASDSNSMTNFAVMEPHKAVQAIRSGLATLDFMRGERPKVPSIPMDINPDLVRLSGCRVKSPQITFSNKTVDIQQHRWSLRDNRKVSPPDGHTLSWGIVSVVKSNPSRRISFTDPEYLEMIRNVWIENGLPINDIDCVHKECAIQDERDPKLDQCVCEVINKLKDQEQLKHSIFLVVCLDEGASKDIALFNRVKVLTDKNHGIHSIVVQKRKFLPNQVALQPDPKEMKTLLSYWTNLALKINLKIGGNNQALSDLDKKDIFNGHLFIGYDVTHPPPKKQTKSPRSVGKTVSAGGNPDIAGSSFGMANLTLAAKSKEPASTIVSPPPANPHECSIAAMVANVDNDFGQWLADVRIQEQEGEQKAGQEMVIKLKEMMESRLDAWKDGTLPQQIIVYRDGVSEGQYQTVIEKELPLIRDACQVKYPKNKQPRITLIVCGKRHHSRFFELKRSGGSRPFDAARYENPQPGTVVDSVVTHKRIWDFYMQSHKPVRGVARGAHYIVLHDDNFYSSERVRENPRKTQQAIQRLYQTTHNLCYINGRALLPIGIPTPAKYADVAADRARRYVADWARRNPNGTLTNEVIQINARLRNSMYWI